MYGIVNKALEDLVKENFGEEKWEIIKDKSGVEEDFFISNEPYDDDITFKLAIATSEVMEIPLPDVLFSFGEWWILNTTNKNYGSLMSSGGNNIREFLINLPNFHNRIMLMYPKLNPPEFRISNIEENSIHIHYFSKREGLKDFVLGLFSGLGKMYNTNVICIILQSREDGSKNEVFKVSW